MPYATLHTRRLIHVTGEEALSFLQGLLTCDVRPAFDGKAVYGALLTPQGKFLHELFLMPWEGGIVLDCDGARYEDLLARLKMYRLRSKVEFTVLADNEGVCALWGEALPVGIDGVALPDPRDEKLGWRIVGNTGHIMHSLAPIPHVDEVDYQHHRIALGIPDGVHDLIPDKSLLMEFGMDELGGIDFAKGCYVGQEVTARSKHRAQLRKGIYIVQGEGPLPAPGTAVTLDGQEVGQLRSVSGQSGLALLATDLAGKLQSGEKKLMAGDVFLSASLPAWAKKDQ